MFICPTCVHCKCRVLIHNFIFHFCSSARIFLGRGAVMAKALGNTPEEEHRQGLHKIANVCYAYPGLFKCIHFFAVLENQRPGWSTIYIKPTPRSHRMVRRLFTTRFRPCWKRCQSHNHPPRRPRHETALRPS